MEIKFEIILKLKEDGTICHWFFTLEEILNGQFKNMIDERYEIIADKREFTGLLDKNGKEIYEGDILRVNKDDKILGFVKFMKGCFFFQSNNQFKDYNCFDEFKGEQFEVIGNIYENHELINGADLKEKE